MIAEKPCVEFFTCDFIFLQQKLCNFRPITVVAKGVRLPRLAIPRLGNLKKMIQGPVQLFQVGTFNIYFGH